MAATTALLMESCKITTFLITGPPGVGKTTLVRKIYQKLQSHGRLRGFYTEEVRCSETGQRTGFDLVTLAGKRGILARDSLTDNKRRPKVGKYAVFVQDFESLAMPLLSASSSEADLLIIDEIGKMELLSKNFELAITELINKKLPFLATIPQKCNLQLVEQLKKSSNSCIYQLTKANRDTLVNEVSEHIVKKLFIAK